MRLEEMHAAGMKPDARDSERSHFIVQFQDCRLEAQNSWISVNIIFCSRLPPTTPSSPSAWEQRTLIDQLRRPNDNCIDNRYGTAFFLSFSVSRMPRKQRVGCVVWQKLVSRQGGSTCLNFELILWTNLVLQRDRPMLSATAQCNRPKSVQTDWRYHPHDRTVRSDFVFFLFCSVLTKFCTAEEFFLKRIRVTWSDPTKPVDIKDRCLCSERRAVTVSVVSAFGAL